MEVVWHSISQSKDYVVTEGTSDIWTYRKWANGTAECWCCIKSSSLSSLTITQAAGYYYIDTAIATPFTFSAINTISTNTAGYMFIGCKVSSFYVNSVSLRLYQYGSDSNLINSDIFVLVQGTWK